MRIRYPALFVLITLILVPRVCLAEVMDKEPTQRVVWAVSGAIAVIGYLLARYRAWMAVPVLALAILLAWARIEELSDPFVGPAIVREAGRGYLIQFYLASAIAVVAPLMGIFQRRMRHSSETSK